MSYTHNNRERSWNIEAYGSFFVVVIILKYGIIHYYYIIMYVAVSMFVFLVAAKDVFDIVE
jgi:hypothetical protein